MLSEFSGRKYKLATSDKFDEYMKALGVGLLTRKFGNSVKPVVELTESDGEYSLSSSSTFKNTIIKFKLGEEFTEDTADGRTVKSVIKQDGNKLIHTQSGDKQSTIIREFTKDEVKMVLTVDDIVCTRIYKLLE